MLNYTKRYLLKNNLYGLFVQRFNALFAIENLPCSDEEFERLKLNPLGEFWKITVYHSPHLEYAFLWSDTPEGDNYWRNVSAKIMVFRDNALNEGLIGT